MRLISDAGTAGYVLGTSSSGLSRIISIVKEEGKEEGEGGKEGEGEREKKKEHKKEKNKEKKKKP